MTPACTSAASSSSEHPISRPRVEGMLADARRLQAQRYVSACTRLRERVQDFLVEDRLIS
jgi:hypothetical protein